MVVDPQNEEISSEYSIVSVVQGLRQHENDFALRTPCILFWLQIPDTGRYCWFPP